MIKKIIEFFLGPSAMPISEYDQLINSGRFTHSESQQAEIAKHATLGDKRGK